MSEWIVPSLIILVIAVLLVNNMRLRRCQDEVDRASMNAERRAIDGFKHGLNTGSAVYEKIRSDLENKPKHRSEGDE